MKLKSESLLIDMLRLLILIFITTAYAMFDVFNRRSLPNIFAYATIAVGIIMTLTYDMHTIELSLLYAAILSGIGYITYKMGILGAGDLYEFVFISLVFPVQLMPFLTNIPQLPFPFILSVFIATGYATVLFTPIYYITKAKKKLGRISVDRKGAWLGIALLAAYVLLIAAVNLIVGHFILPSTLLLLVAIPSAVIIIYKNAIYEGMSLHVYPKELEDGDMIAVNMMSHSELSYFKNKSKRFGRLVTAQLISDIRKINRKIPVYKNAIPLALFTLIGVVVSLLFGNLILLMLS